MHFELLSCVLVSSVTPFNHSNIQPSQSYEQIVISSQFLMLSMNIWGCITTQQEQECDGWGFSLLCWTVLTLVCGVFPIATDYRFTWKFFYDYFMNKSSSVVFLMARLLWFFCDLRHIHPLWMLQGFVIIARCIIHRAAKALSFHLQRCMHKWTKSGIKMTINYCYWEAVIVQ